MTTFVRGLVVLFILTFIAAVGGCVTPYDKYLHPQPTTALYDWRCQVSGRESQNGKPFTMWANDKGIHDLADIVSDPWTVCTWITPEQNCAGAPVDLYNACLVAGVSR